MQVTDGGDRWGFSFNNFFPRPRIIDGTVQGIDKATPRSRLAGPIVKGRLWFSQSFNYRFVRSRVDELPIREGAEVLEGFDSVTQLDYQIDPRNSLTFVFTLFPSDVESLGIDTLHPFEASPDLKTRGFHLSFSERASFGPSELLESLLSIQKFDLAVAPKSDAPSVLTVDGLRGNYFNRFDRASLRIELRQSFIKELRSEGHVHTWTAGRALARTEYDGFDESSPVDLLRADGTRFQRIEWAGDPDVGAENTEIAAFLQDRWRPSPALQLDLGLRYDREGSRASTIWLRGSPPPSARSRTGRRYSRAVSGSFTTRSSSTSRTSSGASAAWSATLDLMAKPPSGGPSSFGTGLTGMRFTRLGASTGTSRSIACCRSAS